MKFDKIAVYAFFFIVLCIGLITFRDYGLSNDELSCHDLGTLNYYYITENNNTLLRYSDRDYPPIYETFIVAIEKILGLSQGGSAEIFYLRHFLNFIIFYLGCFVFYLTCKNFFNSRWIGLTAVCMLVLCPRIYGHAFINSKDIPFMSFMILSIFSAVEFLKSPSLVKGFIHAFFCALAIDTRIAGVLVPGITFCLYLTQIVAKPREHLWKSLASIICYMLFLVALVILMWPMLWHDPVKHFVQYFHSAAHFRYPYSIYYLGQWLDPVNHQLPWHYLPMWILATVPVSVLFLFIIGLGSFITSFRRNHHEYLQKPLILIAFGWFVIPMAVSILTKPTMYDGWRHFYFIYPAMIILAIHGLMVFFKSKIISKILVGLLLFDLCITAFRMASFHPYEHLCFNQLKAPTFKGNLKSFQIDSWGVEFIKPLRTILNTDRSEHIKIFSTNIFTPVNLFLLSEEQKRRIQFVHSPLMADYCILDYYYLLNRHPPALCEDKTYSLDIQDVNILTVYRKNT